MNRKVVNTDPKFYNGIQFKSTLEVSCYKKLEQTDFEFAYESETVDVLAGQKLNNCISYTPKKHHGKLEKILSKVTGKIQAITYTPDFVVKTDSIIAYFDVKGFPNDTYPLKKKLFLNVLEHRDDGHQYMFFEPHSVSQMIQAIEIINKIKQNGKKEIQ